MIKFKIFLKSSVSWPHIGPCNHTIFRQIQSGKTVTLSRKHKKKGDTSSFLAYFIQKTRSFGVPILLFSFYVQEKNRVTTVPFKNWFPAVICFLSRSEVSSPLSPFSSRTASTHSASLPGRGLCFGPSVISPPHRPPPQSFSRYINIDTLQHLVCLYWNTIYPIFFPFSHNLCCNLLFFREIFSLFFSTTFLHIFFLPDVNSPPPTGGGILFKIQYAVHSWSKRSLN